MKEAAILVDGAFFLKRYFAIVSKVHPPNVIADNLYATLLNHLYSFRDIEGTYSLYRIFFYDCPPLEKKVRHPLTGRNIDYSKTELVSFRKELHNELKKKRKLALRLGHLKDESWVIEKNRLKKLLKKEITIDDLTEEDILHSIKQKSIDMKIGIDIASLAYKKLVKKIILVAGDSDFVPAAKLARREGVDFVLDPMWNDIAEDLNEHIDGLKSYFPNPAKRQGFFPES
ncbi:MAG TPA: NYN domain-containing protein [bacterium]|nr:NYN domain-containing protein [bacterium]